MNSKTMTARVLRTWLSTTNHLESRGISQQENELLRSQNLGDKNFFLAKLRVTSQLMSHLKNLDNSFLHFLFSPFVYVRKLPFTHQSRLNDHITSNFSALLETLFNFQEQLDCNQRVKQYRSGKALPWTSVIAHSSILIYESVSWLTFKVNNRAKEQEKKWEVGRFELWLNRLITHP